jgi:hypothetical protein
MLPLAGRRRTCRRRWALPPQAAARSRHDLLAVIFRGYLKPSLALGGIVFAAEVVQRRPLA